MIDITVLVIGLIVILDGALDIVLNISSIMVLIEHGILRDGCHALAMDDPDCQCNDQSGNRAANMPGVVDARYGKTIHQIDAHNQYQTS